MDVPKTLGKYEIRGTLGRGAMGVVYDGWDPLIARRVAVKSVPLPTNPDPETEEEIARFRREAQAAGRLTHPNIVAVYDYGETADAAYIVMEHVDGPTLKNLLDKKERFSVENIVRVMGDLLAGLQFSHERGVVHRDVKPGNLMLTSGGQAKIADFGIARIEMSSMTQAGTMLGTPAYMSPEQFRGEAADARTDVYSAGVLLYQLLTGERPFEGGLTTIMHKVLNVEPPAPSELAGTVPKSLDAVVRKAMAKRPQDRYASAAAFADALRAAAAAPAGTEAEEDEEATLVRPGKPAAAPVRAAPAAKLPPIPTPAPAARPSRLPLIAVIVVVVLVVAAGAGWYFTRPGEPPVQVAQTTPPVTPKPAEPATDKVQPPETKVQTPEPAKVGPVEPVQVQPAPTTTKTAQVQPAEPPVAPAQTPPKPEASQPAPTTTTTAANPPALPPAEPIVTKPAEPPAVRPTVPATPAQTVPPQPQPVVQPPAPPEKTQPPEKMQTATIAPLAMLQQIGDVLHAKPCALADAALQDSGGFSVNGFSDAASASSLRREVAGLPGTPQVAWHVRTIDPVLCPALSALRPVSPLAGGPRPGVGLTLAGSRVLHEDDPILPRITMPDFAGELRVDYLVHDGTLAHLYPTAADPQEGWAAQPLRHFSAGERIALGDRAKGKPYWPSGPPFGTDMIIAVVSSVPLHVGGRPNGEDKGNTYLADLGRAIEEARTAGAKISGALLLVDAIPKAK